MTARLAVTLLATLLAFGGIGIAVTDVFGDDDEAAAMKTIELRKDDAGGAELVDDEVPTPQPGDGDDTRGDDGTSGGNNTGDGDRTRGDDGTRGGDNTGDRDSTRGNDGTRGGDNTGDRDATAGDDGTGGGDNSYVAPAAVYGGGDDSGGGGTTG
jgi:hypothetical protein